MYSNLVNHSELQVLYSSTLSQSTNTINLKKKHNSDCKGTYNVHAIKENERKKIEFNAK